MPRKSFRPEEIIAKLREADVLLGQGKKVAKVVQALGVSEVTYYYSPAITPDSLSAISSPRAVSGIFMGN